MEKKSTIIRKLKARSSLLLTKNLTLQTFMQLPSFLMKDPTLSGEAQLFNSQYYDFKYGDIEKLLSFANRDFLYLSYYQHLRYTHINCIAIGGVDGESVKFLRESYGPKCAYAKTIFLPDSNYFGVGKHENTKQSDLPKSKATLITSPLQCNINDETLDCISKALESRDRIEGALVKALKL